MLPPSSVLTNRGCDTAILKALSRSARSAPAAPIDEHHYVPPLICSLCIYIVSVLCGWKT